MKRQLRLEPRYRPTNAERAMILSVANEDLRLKHAAFRILEYLLQHHNDRIGLVCPSQKRIAKDLRFSERWVGEMVRLLRRTGYIFTERMGGSRGHYRYYFRLEKLELFKRPRGTRGHRSDGGKLENDRPELERTNDRNCSSDKHLKKYIKLEAKNERSAHHSAEERSQPRNQSVRKQREPQSDPISKLAERLGGGEAAWLVLQEIPTDELDELRTRLRLGLINMDDAMTLVVERSQVDRE